MASFAVWDRQPNETSRAYALFAHYRDAGPLERSYSNTARELGVKYRTIEQLSQRFGWVQRANAWDAENDKIKRATQVKELEGMARRQTLAGQLFMSKGLKRIQAMSDAEIQLMSVWEAVRLTEAGVRLERLGRGEPGDLDTPYIGTQQNLIIGSSADAPLVELIRRNPARVGPVVELLAELQRQLPDMLDNGKVYDAANTEYEDLVNGAGSDDLDDTVLEHDETNGADT